MNVPTINKTCFLCRTDGLRQQVTRKRRKENLHPEIIFKYLLQSKTDKYDNLLESILKASRASEDGEDSAIKFCTTCESSIARISELHLQLEATHMKIINCLNTVREVILGASRKDEGPVWSTKVFATQLGDPGAQSISQIMNLFQDAVSETQEKSLPIPLVYPERYVNFNPNRGLENAAITDPPASFNSSSPLGILTPEVIKVEVSPAHVDDDLDDNESLAFPEDVDDNMDFEEAESDVDLPRNLEPKDEKDETNVVPLLRKRKVRSNPSTPNNKRKCVRKTEERRINKKHPKFKCEVCHYETAMDDIFRFEHHLVNHETSDKSFKCSECPDHPGFSGEQLYQLHLEHHRARRRKCLHCDQKVSRVDYAEHYRKHVDSIFQCDFCTFSTTSEGTYLRHLEKMRGHSSSFKCHICEEIFSSEPTLRVHLHDEHGAIKKLVCEVDNCGQEFLSTKRLNQHKVDHHDKHNEYVCQECGKTCKGITSFKSHQKRHPGKGVIFSCDQCPRTFTNHEASLIAHKIRDHGAPKFKCDQCEKEYATKYTLRLHVQSVHEGVKYRCDICKETFESLHRLKRHEEGHLSPDKLTCKICGKKYSTRPKLRQHMEIHTGERKFKCSQCPQTFVYKMYLTQHLRIHTGEKPYVCQKCGKAFRQKCSLYEHKTNVRCVPEESDSEEETGKETEEKVLDS